MNTKTYTTVKNAHLSIRSGNHKLRVAFICIHNSCRSQIAEAFARTFASDTFDAYSAGTDVADHINPDAIRLMKHNFGITMEEQQYSKSIAELPDIDVVITMGCQVNCPHLPCSYREDWGITDPTGLDDDSFMQIIHQIHYRVMTLKERIEETN